MEWQTKFGPLNSQTVREAFDATGMEADPMIFIHGKSGCALGAFCEYHAPGEIVRICKTNGWDHFAAIKEILGSDCAGVSAWFFGEYERNYAKGSVE